MNGFPRVKDVTPLEGRKLLVSFDNGERRVYDCAHLLGRPAFQDLRSDAFFGAVRPDPHGFGIVWNDDVDLAESELWLGGQHIGQDTVP